MLRGERENLVRSPVSGTLEQDRISDDTLIGRSRYKFKLEEIGMINLEYITNKDGEAIGVVIPIDLWRQLLPTGEASEENLTEAVEDYCLNKAMNEAVNTPLLGRAEALAYLEE